MIGAHGVKALLLASALLSATACRAEGTNIAGRSNCDAGGASACVTFSPTLPQLTGRVVDSADLLSATAEERLTRALQTLETRTRDQLVVVTVPDLQGVSIDQYGLALGNAWHVGQKTLDNGVLLIVAPSERTARIEVGIGLEGLLTDELASKIMDDILIPHFRSGDFEQGVSAGTREIIRILESETRRPQPQALQKVA